MRYQICEADSAEKLQRAVEGWLRLGWQPQGGVAVVNSHQSGNWWYYQALVLVDEGKPPGPDDPDFG